MIKCFLIFNLLWHPLCCLIDYLFNDGDQSALLLEDASPFLKHAIRWDAFFYLEIIQHGYRWDKNHAFFPGM